VKQLPFVGRTARYALIAAICAAASNAVIILGDVAGGHYVPVIIFAFAVVTPLGYFLHSSFTFGERRSWVGLLRFVSAGALAFPLSLLTMAILCTGLGLRVAIAAPIATVLLFVWNYASAHWAIVGRLHLQCLPSHQVSQIDSNLKEGSSIRPVR
jgi:putative flippase GtrA